MLGYFQAPQERVKQLQEGLQLKKQDVKNLKSTKFSCEKDARATVERLSKKLPYHFFDEITIQRHNYTGRRGRPTKKAPTKQVYRVSAQLFLDEQEKSERQSRMGKFIIATNELDTQLLSKQDLLNHYKDQQSVERGFRFVKDPFFLCF